MKEFTVSYTIWDIKIYVLYPFHNSLFVMLCTIWYHLYNLKKRQKHSWRSDTSACNLPKSITSSWVFFTFFKLCKWYQIAQGIAHFVFQEVKGRIRVYDHFFFIRSI